MAPCFLGSAVAACPAGAACPAAGVAAAGVAAAGVAAAGVAAGAGNSTFEAVLTADMPWLSKPAFAKILETLGASVGAPAFFHKLFNFLAVTCCPSSRPADFAPCATLAAPFATAPPTALAALAAPFLIASNGPSFKTCCSVSVSSMPDIYFSLAVSYNALCLSTSMLSAHI